MDMRRLILSTFVSVLVAAAQPPVTSRQFRIDELKTPPGFSVSVYARVSGGPRMMTFGPNGVLYVAARNNGIVYAIPDHDQAIPVLRGLNGPHSLEFHDGDLYVATDNAVLRFRAAVTPALVISSGAEQLASLPSGTGHTTRTLTIGPDGTIYVSAGSTCNFCVESDSRCAAVSRYDADGGNQAVYARGLRNSVGLAWHPVTGELWATDNGGDGLGEDIPADEINILRAGNDYGWPDCYSNQVPLNWGPEARTSRCAQTTAPEFQMQAHSAPLGISFYSGSMFPVSYQGDALVAFHGSWNRNEPTGYKVVRVNASSGHATGIQDFLWGFLDTTSRTTSGRPVHALSGPDGSVYVSDDATGNIYRVVYTGPRINPGGVFQRAARVFELYGTNLAGDPAQVSILANGVAVNTLYVSLDQINFVLPDAMSGSITIQVVNEKGSDQITLTL
jgi:glucose/arabinose dehydrogenase